MAIKLRAPFETGFASTGHRIEGGICIVDTAEQAAYMAGPPFYFQVLGEVSEAEEPAGQGAPPAAPDQPEPKRRRR